MTFRRHGVYKDSGVEWLGDVPAHWQWVRLRRLFHIEKRIAGTTGYDVLSVTQRGLRVKDIDSNDGQLSDDYSKYQNVNARDFVMNGMDLLTGYVDIAQTIGVTSPDYRVFRLRHDREHDCFARYYLYMFQMAYKRKIFYAFGQGASQLGRWRLPPDEFNAFIVPFPPRDEQTAIADFLDRETAKIDALIAEQERLIVLLKEKRQAVISNAVAKGLDPNAPMKASGVEWLGEVPAHWDRVQLGRVCVQVSDGPHFSPNYVDEGVMFVSARNIRVDGWSLGDVKYISEKDYVEFSRRVVPEEGDVLYTKGGTTGIARVIDFPDRFQVWVHVAVLKLNQSLVDPYFLAYSLNSAGCYEQSQLLTRGATNQDLGLTRMIKIWFALPHLGQQREIVQFLDRETGALDQLVAHAERATTLLQERRSALISAAVTGKIDVRNFVPAAAEAA